MIRFDVRVLFPFLLFFIGIIYSGFFTYLEFEREFDSLKIENSDYVKKSLDLLEATYVISQKAGSKETLENLIASFSKNLSIHALVFINHKNEIFISNNRSQIGMKQEKILSSIFPAEQKQIIQKIKQLKKDKKPIVYFSQNKDEFIGLYPIYTSMSYHKVKPDQKGFIFLVYRIKEIKEKRIYKIYEHLLLLISLNLILLSLAFLVFHFAYSKRIKKLISNTRKFGEGCLDCQIQIGGKDELAELSSSFNAMVKKVKNLAYHDHLTGSLNRFSIEKVIDSYISNHSLQSFCFFYLDLDGFKDVNDSLGHSIGDKILLEVAIRIKLTLPIESQIARIGGDEFGIFIKHYSDKFEIEQIAKALLKELSQEFYVEKNSIHLSASIGIVFYPENGQRFETILKNADAAMYAGKIERKNTYTFFNSQMAEDILMRMSVLNCLHKALDRKEFFMVYQPVVLTTVGKVEAYMESLIRWDNKEHNVYPDYFIPLLEESNLIRKVGRWIIDRVCQQVEEWLAMGLNRVHLNVNVSTQQLFEKDFYHFLVFTIEKYKIPPSCLTLEITESEIMDRPDKIIKLLTKIRRLGIRIAIDDFGTGYSSLSYLKYLPIDLLKIDKSFIMAISENPNDAEIVKTIIALAQSMKIETVAEGVEDKKTYHFLKSIGCTYCQGYYFGKPQLPEYYQNSLLPKIQK